MNKITRSGAIRVNTTSSGQTLDDIQQQVSYASGDIETLKKSITLIQNININYNNRIVVLENENIKLKHIIKLFTPEEHKLEVINMNRLFVS